MRRLYLGVSVLSFLLALFSKESAVVFPLMLIFYEGCFRRDGLKGKKSAKYAFYVAALLIYVQNSLVTYPGIPKFRRVNVFELFYGFGRILFYPFPDNML